MTGAFWPVFERTVILLSTARISDAVYQRTYIGMRATTLAVRDIFETGNEGECYIDEQGNLWRAIRWTYHRRWTLSMRSREIPEWTFRYGGDYSEFRGIVGGKCGKHSADHVFDWNGQCADRRFGRQDNAAYGAVGRNAKERECFFRIMPVSGVEKILESAV